MKTSIADRYLEKLRNGSATEQDNLKFRDWLAQASDEEAEYALQKHASFFENLPDETSADHHLAQLIEQGVDQSMQQPVSKPQKHIKQLVLRASIAVAASLAIFFIVRIVKDDQSLIKPVLASKTISKPIVPGSNKAILTLDNGKSITLDSVAVGVLAQQNNVSISKSANGQLMYKAPISKEATTEFTYNKITVPRGGQYQVVLPDGTKVWLNAASSLRYPVNFLGDSRNVELTGEAYFEVAKDKRHPFKVSINNMQVQVLGTHFNIMGYEDEGVTKTTLLEGSVKIIKGQSQQLIKPGQQAAVKEQINVTDVDVAEAVQWKNGNFNFSHEKLESIMRKISRWYDVDVSYKGNTTKATFVGTLPRSTDINEVLNYLKLTGLVNFDVTERRVTAMP